MAAQHMLRDDLKECLNNKLKIAENFRIYEQILNLPYSVFVEVINLLCSGDLIEADMDGRVYELEKQLSNKSTQTENKGL
jgi:hypothetical protein